MSELYRRKLPPITHNTIAHLLIGLPGSGKSTLAKIIAQTGDYEIISTDEIREQLYGDATIQGDWQTIETEALNHIHIALTQGKSVIYDATNFKRAFRMDFLQKVKKKTKSFNLIWIGWLLETPLETCLAWNKQRTRQVPEAIIINMHKVLKDFPPIAAEGFARVKTIDVTSFQCSTSEIEKEIKILSRSITNSQNRNANITLHRYSNLLDFDRLMHLIALIIKYPGIGNLRNTNPVFLEKIIGEKLDFANDIEEIAAILTKKHGAIYASEQGIINDLKCLAEQEIITQKEKSSLKKKSEFNFESCSTTAMHSYSDKQAFDRLIGTIQLIVNQPFLPDAGEGSLRTLAKALEEARVIPNANSGLSMLRKDIENVLRPYKIIPDFSMRNGYFAGTGILSRQELIKAFEILQSQAKSLNDPLGLDFYNTFKQRMLQSKMIDPEEDIYPVRSIANRSIVDDKHLHETSLLKKLSYLESAIVQGGLLELNRFISSARYEGDANSFIHVYPLQIVFHNLAWYLGFECVRGEEPGLLRFERLDRLFLGDRQHQNRSRQEQEKSLKKLHKLLKGTAGIFLGNSTADQIQFLSKDKNISSQACITIELWFNNSTYRFIIEGTRRFTQIKMSRPQFPGKVNLPKSIFCWEETTGDPKFPNRFQVVLAKWALDDFDLLKWIVGFGGNVKVIAPAELVEKVKEIGYGIVDNYKTDS